MKYIFLTVALLLTVIDDSIGQQQGNRLPLLKVSDNKHFIVDENGNPFFWLGDTGWLLFKKLTRKEAETFLENRRKKGFNVIQAMVIHELNNCINVYGDSAFINQDISKPLEIPGDSFEDSTSYDYWDHLEYIIKLAEEKGLYMALVPLWGSNVKNNHVTTERATDYGAWIADKFKSHQNIIWLNGGDVYGTDSMEVWKALGNALNNYDPRHLITFHPRGRTQSSTWFHNEEWLDFNMIQSGHRRYDQDDTELSYGEDNWKYIQTDYDLSPPKPTIDGEPSYEGIPQGLHDTLQPYWTDADARRYAYWSVFAGAFGHTYGHNAVMQFYKPGDAPAYGAKIYWDAAMNEPGASQMKYLRELMLSRPFFDRVPDQSIIAENDGEKYDYLLATRGPGYVFVYTCTGKKMQINMGKVEGDKVKASWFNPGNGETQEIGIYKNSGTTEFNPPRKVRNGNDWVLILDAFEP